MNKTFRIHPSIGISRVGNSEEYILSPETIAGLQVSSDNETHGGLPIPLDGSSFKSGDLHDANGALKRQAQRFKIYQYESDGSPETYPLGSDNTGSEIVIGSTVGNKTVTDIIWTVHLANKKANCYETPEIKGREDYIDGQQPSRFKITQGVLDTLSSEGVPDSVITDLESLLDPAGGPYTDPQLLPEFNESVKQAIGDENYALYRDEIDVASVNFYLRNLEVGTQPNPIQAPSPNDPERLQKLTIDAGPQSIMGSSTGDVNFDNGPTVSYWEAGSNITQSTQYHKIFPEDNYPNTLQSVQGDITTLGALKTDDEGRLHVLGGYGRSAGWNKETDYKLTSSTDNDEYYDDTSDGPVHAVLVFDDGSVQQVQASSWVIVSDPAYAPQTLNIVSLWDEIYNTWVRNFDLQPEVFTNGAYQSDYKPAFSTHINPLLQATKIHKWNLNLPDTAKYRHDAVGDMQEAPDNFVNTYIRNIDTDSGKSGFMPLSLGDVTKSFLAPSESQYFFLTQWQAGNFIQDFDTITGSHLGAGEYLDYAVLLNCLGGRFSPGIEMTFVCRDLDLYIQNWTTSGVGPFRIHTQDLNYAHAQKGTPFLNAGYFPGTKNSPGLQPGDASKFMSVPWHTDYNSCATHTTSPPPDSGFGNPQTLYWSWPSQRPLTAYLASEVTMNGSTATLGEQRYSVRGPGTLFQANPDGSDSDMPVDPQQVGRYQNINNILDHWQKIGVIVQATTIDDAYPADWYLEVGSELPVDGEDPVPVFPTYSTKPNT